MGELKFKYRIDELLNQLSVKQYRHALSVIPQYLAVSPKTFANYRNIRLNDTRDIPHEKVAILEKLFSLQPGGLQNFKIEVTPLYELNKNNLNN